MFLDVFQRAYDEKGVTVTMPAVVYLYFGVVGAIDRTFAASRERGVYEVARFTLDDVLRQEIDDLGGPDKVGQQLASRDVIDLVEYLASEGGSKIDVQASTFLGQLLGRAVEVVVFTSADMVIEQQRRPLLLMPADIVAACKAVFKNKWWFLC